MWRSSYGPGQRKEIKIAGPPVPSVLTHAPLVPQAASLHGQTAEEIPAAANGVRSLGRIMWNLGWTDQQPASQTA